MVVSLATVPVSAGLITSEEFDQRAECGATAARMIIIGSDEGVVFPEDANQCQNVEGEAGDDSQNEPSRFTPASESNIAKRSLDMATLSPVSSR
jgi:hypothetical protein